MVSVTDSASGVKLYLSIIKDYLFNEEARRKEKGADIYQTLITKGRVDVRAVDRREKEKVITNPRVKGELCRKC